MPVGLPAVLTGTANGGWRCSRIHRLLPWQCTSRNAQVTITSKVTRWSWPTTAPFIIPRKKQPLTQLPGVKAMRKGCTKTLPSKASSSKAMRTGAWPGCKMSSDKPRSACKTRVSVSVPARLCSSLKKVCEEGWKRTTWRPWPGAPAYGGQTSGSFSRWTRPLKSCLTRLTGGFGKRSSPLHGGSPSTSIIWRSAPF